MRLLLPVLVLACACNKTPHGGANPDGGADPDGVASIDGATSDAGADVGSDGGVLTMCPGDTYPGPASCGDGHWKWDRPGLTGYTLTSIVSFAPSDVWAVGDTGTVMHYDGATWTVESTPVCDGLASLWGTSSTNLWAVGANGRVLHRAADGWHVIDSGSCAALYSVWGSPTGTIWIAGDKGTILRGNTSGFTPVAFPTTDFLPSLWGFSDSDVWAIDARTALYHWNGTTWTNVVSSNTWSWDTIWGTDPDHLFIGGYTWSASNNTIWSFSEATAATPSPTIISGSESGSFGGTSSTDAWYVFSNAAYHFDGSHWTATGGVPLATQLTAVATASAGDAWAVGWEGERLHWNGGVWTDVAPVHDARGVWAASSTDAWLATTNGLEHWNGSTWSTPMTSGFYDVVWGTSSADVYAVGFGAATHWNGSAWTTLALPPVASYWHAVAGSSSNDIWIGGYGGGLVHWNGTAWSTVTATTSTINALWAFASNDVWAATTSGLLHWNGSTWSVTGPLTTPALHVWGSSPSNLYAGGYGVLYHFDGVSWTMSLTHANTEFDNMWGQAANDVWVLENGTIDTRHHAVHWDGQQWTTYVDVSSMQLLGLGGSGNEVWATDLQGGLVHFAP